MTAALPVTSDDRLDELLRACRRSSRGVLTRSWSASPPQVMQSLTTVTLADLVGRLPRPVAAACRVPLRLRFGQQWAQVPVFTAALRLRGSLQSAQPLRSAVIDLPCPGWPPSRVGTLLAVGIWVDHERPTTRLRVLLLGSTHTPLRTVTGAAVTTVLAPVWRLLTGAWLDAVGHDLELVAARRRPGGA